jgi:hypothetical protein
LKLFFQDLRNSGMTHITPTPMTIGGSDVYVEVPSSPLDDCQRQGLRLRYYKHLPFAHEYYTPPTGSAYWKVYGENVWPLQNNSFNCSPANPYFCGWDHTPLSGTKTVGLYGLVEAVLSNASLLA